MSSQEGRNPDAASRAAHASLSLAGTDAADALDFAGFANTMASLASTVCVATAALGDERYGRTVTAVTSLSAQPPTLLVSIAKDSDLARLIEETKRFSLSLLAQGQQAIGDAFAGKGDVTDRFGIGTWEKWPSGQPKLAGAASSIECRLAGTIELDDRRVFIGVLIGAETSEASPLIWYERSYHGLAPL